MDPEILGRLFRALHDEGVRYVLFGGLAVGALGLSRATRDVGLFLAEDAANIEAARRALERVFADPELREITPAALSDFGLVRYGPPDHDFVIDLTVRIGEAFRYSDLESRPIELFGVQVPVATPRTLIRMKRDTIRPQDQADVQRLRERFQVEED